MPIPARINIVTLGVADLGRSIAFYEALGWERAAASLETIAWFQLAGSVLGLFGWDDLAADAGVEAGQPGRFEGITLAINLPEEKDVDDALAAAVAAGGSIVKQAEKMDWGGYSGYFADPDGHLWEVAWNPTFFIGPDGLLRLE